MLLAVEVERLDLASLHLMVREKSQQWSNVCSYVKTTNQRQDF